MQKKDNDTNFLDDITRNLTKFSHLGQLGQEIQSGTKLSKTDEGARTNARIEAAEKGEAFDESQTSPEELKNAETNMINELLNRAVNDIFKV